MGKEELVEFSNKETGGGGVSEEVKSGSSCDRDQ